MPAVKRTPVREVMTTAVVTAGDDMPFRHLVAFLYAKGIGAVPVVAPAGQVLGVVSNADLPAKAAGLPPRPDCSWSFPAAAGSAGRPERGLRAS
jgi:CBS domain-containing protein